jgi:hypothetical protein
MTTGSGLIEIEMMVPKRPTTRVMSIPLLEIHAEKPIHHSNKNSVQNIDGSKHHLMEIRMHIPNDW